MTSPALVSRRTVLTLAAVGGGSLLGAYFFGGSAARLDTAARLRSIFSKLSVAQNAGAVYLANHPNEHDAEYLAAAIVPGSRLRWSLRTDAEVEQFVQEHISSEYATDVTVELEGWIVARTEARLYALLSLRD